MTDALNRPLPPARERNRGGVRWLDWSVPPAPEEGLIDRTKVRIRGTVFASNEAELRAYAHSLTDSVLVGPRFFGSVSRSANGSFILSILNGWSVAGRVELRPRAAGVGSFLLRLDLNPTRTLAHLLERYPAGEWPLFWGLDFFRVEDEAPATATLDRRDNFIQDFSQVGGTAYASRARSLSRYLEIYERALARLVQDLFCPPAADQRVTYENSRIVAEGDGRRVEIEWGSLSLLQCECYWERASPSALAFVRHVADRLLGAARAVSVNAYELDGRLRLEREEGALSVAIGQGRGSTTLAIYAKAHDRVRFEVRYYDGDIPQSVRNAGGTGLYRLSNMLAAVRADAAHRIRWDGLREALEVWEREPRPLDLIELAESVRAATHALPEAFRPTLEALLLTGGVSASDGAGGCPHAVVAQLAAAGVVERIRLVPYEVEAGRRYALTRRFRHLARALSSAGHTPQA